MKKILGFMIIIILITISFVSLIPTYVNAENLKTGQVYVGYSKINIDPNPSNGKIPLSGYGNTYTRIARFEGDEQKDKQSLYATAVAIKDKDNNIVVFVTLDLGALSSTLSNQIRNKVTEYTGIGNKYILLSCTHTHSAPDTGFANSSYPELNASVNEYNELLKEKIPIVCQNAVNKLEPSNIYINSIDVIRDDGKNALNFVRHYTTDSTYSDGQRITVGDSRRDVYWDNGILKTAKIKSNTTTADATMQLIKFELPNKEKNDRDIVMINWQTHPHVTGSASMTTVSSDFIERFRNRVQNACNCYVAYYTGAAGNINWNTRITDGSQGIEGITHNYTKRDSEEAKNLSIEYGKKLAEYVEQNYNKFTKVSGGEVIVRQNTISVDRKTKADISDELLVNAKYCMEIWNSSSSSIAKMLEGKYDWKDIDFPPGYDASGAQLRYVVNAHNTLKSAYSISGNDQSGYKCEVKSEKREMVALLIGVMGVGFKERIYSPYHANNVISTSKVEEGTKFNLTIDAISIGDIAFTTVPYEMFCSNGQYIKNNSPHKMTFVLELTNGKEGYIPSAYGYEYGCYEADTTKAKKGAGELLAKKLVSMLEDSTPPELTVAYSKTDPTNSNVMVTITANEQIQEIAGWSLSADQKNLTKVYTENTTETVIAKDLAGNINRLKVIVNNIDRIAPKLDIKYSTTTTTNGNVTVTITANKEVQGVAGWTLSTDKKSLTKTYETNAEEEVTVKDLAGNETKATVKVANIDKTALTLQVRYSTTATTNGNVTVTITANKEVQEVAGWTLSQDKKTLTKTYEANAEEEVTVKDLVGNETKATVKVANIDKTAPTLQVKYSTTATTNGNVTVTITANKEVLEVAGWTLSQDRKTLTKTYEANAEEEVTVKDLVGNETKVTVKVANIDKTAPTLQVKYSTTATTNGNVTVTITANKEVQGVAGWTLSTDKKSLTKTYEANAEEEVTVKDLVGNETKATVKVANIDKTTQIFESPIYEISNNIINYVQPNTKLVDFEKNINTNMNYTIKEGNKQIDETSTIKTGQILAVKDKSYILVVLGDVNGDGKANIKDIMEINKHRLKKKSLTSEYLKAGDVNKDETVNIKDILKVNKYRLRKITEF